MAARLAAEASVGVALPSSQVFPRVDYLLYLRISLWNSTNPVLYSMALNAALENNLGDDSGIESFVVSNLPNGWVLRISRLIPLQDMAKIERAKKT
jgi:hypothetical protein